MNTTNPEIKTDISICGHCDRVFNPSETKVSGVCHDGFVKHVGNCCLDQLDLILGAAISRNAPEPYLEEMIQFIMSTGKGKMEATSFHDEDQNECAMLFFTDSLKEINDYE